MHRTVLQLPQYPGQQLLRRTRCREVHLRQLSAESLHVQIRQYRAGIASLDKLAGGDFTKVSAAKQDTILAKASDSTFLSLLFEHTIEGLYSNPEYGGNRNLAGWTDIKYPGDSQPRGYTADEVSRSDGPDPVDKSPIVTEALKFLGAV